jgi:hypothetical protein
MHTPDVRAAAHALGGDIIGRDQVLCPGPGHSPRDRSLAVRFVADGFVVHSHANDDWQTCSDHVSARLGWDHQRPATKPARMRATPQAPDDTVDRSAIPLASNRSREGNAGRAIPCRDTPA